MKNENTFDAIVVGSGITGGYAAMELTKKGLKVLMLDRGRHVEHKKDYEGEHSSPWDHKFRDRGDRKLFDKDYKVQQKCYAMKESTKHFFVNDRENPYTTDEDKPFYWLRGNQLGGRSLMWGRQCYRWSNLDFTANKKDGHGVDWPIRYEDIEPWYDYVEEFVGVSGQAEGSPVLPDGKFLPPMKMNCVEKHFKSMIADNYDDRLMTIGRVAVLTKKHNGREPCHYCGPCERGCSTGSYFSTQSATLPVAQATGNLTVKVNSIAERVLYDEKSNRATGVKVIDAMTNEVTEYSAKVIFLCASTLGTTQLLLNSATERFPNGLGNSSGVLGKYLMDHSWVFGASGDIAGFDDKYHQAHRPNGTYITRFKNVKGQEEGYLRGFAYQAKASRPTWTRGLNTPGFGADFKASLHKPGPWSMRLAGFGEMLPYEDNYVELNHDVKDKWGIPTLKINCTFHKNELDMMKDMKASAVDMLEKANASNIQLMGTPEEHPPGIGIHEMGTARMGRDPKTSFLNANNQSHEIPNLFVTDGACMTSSAIQNPSITYMALTARACEFAFNKMQSSEI